MPRYEVGVECTVCKRYVVDAESAEEAEQNAMDIAHAFDMDYVDDTMRAYSVTQIGGSGSLDETDDPDAQMLLLQEGGLL